MGDLKKIFNGQRVDRFPNRTVNALIDGELRDRQRSNGRPPVSAPSPQWSVYVRLVWRGSVDLPPGSAVKLGQVIVDPADDESTPFDGLSFFAEEPGTPDIPTGTTNAVPDVIAITQCPISKQKAATLETPATPGTGYGHLPQAAWARVDVQALTHDYASAINGSTTLQSSGAGKFRIVWKGSSTGVQWCVVLIAEGSPPAATFGVLIADVPACAVVYDPLGTSIAPGIAEDAVIPMRVDPVGMTITNATDTAGDQLVVRAVNPIWPTTIKAGTTTDADKPVIVTGYETYWEDVPAFVFDNVIYPLTMMTGLTQGAVAGGAFTADNLELIWGRDPEVTELTVANPDAWTADDNAYCLIMQIVDGTWIALYISCPAP